MRYYHKHRRRYASNRTAIRNRELPTCPICGENPVYSLGDVVYRDCEVCYWTRRRELYSVLPSLLKRRNDLRHDLPTMEADRDRLFVEFGACLRNLESARPLWKKLIGLEASSNELAVLRAQYGAADAIVDSAEKEIEDLRRKIDSAKSIEAELRDALIRQASRRERESQERARIAGVLTRSEEAVESDEFDRTRFSIINADYKRGNKIDNYLRNRKFDVI